jgi:hypothetical protein
MKRYPCRSCGKRFPATHALARHVRHTHPRKAAPDVIVSTQAEVTSSQQLSYALGRVQGFVDAFAEGAGLPRGPFAVGLAELFLAAAERALRGAPRDLPRLRGHTTG